ncbi:MAG: LysR family transcriptional regulator [Rhodothermales bacterium]|nr:LysR family transcriptional regulator [Rhodothermales bacterium]
MDALSIDHLRSFVTIAETGSYTRAAELLFRTQPALSHQINKLEGQLGSRILDRSGRELKLTEAGTVLLDYARRILSLNEEALDRLNIVQTAGSLRVGVLEEVANGPLVDLLTRFGRLCTNIEIELLVSTSWELARLIRENALELAVANEAYTDDDVVPLWTEEYVWAVHESYEIPTDGPLPLLLDPAGSLCAARAEAVEALRAMNRPWKTVFSSVSVAAISAAIRAGLGIGMIARSSITNDMRIVGEEEGLPAITPSCIGLYRAADARSDAANMLADFLIQHLVRTDERTGYEWRSAVTGM